MLSPEQRARMQEVIDCVDASLRLEGFEKNDMKRAIDEALLDGRVDSATVSRELLEYVKKNKTVDGFLDDKEWAIKR